MSILGEDLTPCLSPIKNSLAKPILQEEAFKEVLAVMPVDTSKPSLEQDARTVHPGGG